MENQEKLVTRSKKVAFYGVKDKFNRMTGFTTMSRSSNPKEYARQYVDEEGEITDVTGYSPSIEYAFDQHENNAVHNDIIEITENECIGNEAVRTIITVDFTKPVGEAENTYEARKREYAIIPSTDGDGIDVYTYSGVFKSKSSLVKGTATIDANNTTVTFTVAE